MIVVVFKAQPLTGRSEDTPNLTIQATVPFPECETLEQAAKVHTTAGTAIANAIFDHLPGGTIDALLAELLRRRASLFAVRFNA